MVDSIWEAISRASLSENRTDPLLPLQQLPHILHEKERPSENQGKGGSFSFERETEVFEWDLRCSAEIWLMRWPTLTFGDRCKPKVILHIDRYPIKRKNFVIGQTTSRAVQSSVFFYQSKTELANAHNRGETVRLVPNFNFVENQMKGWGQCMEVCISVPTQLLQAILTKKHLFREPRLRLTSNSSVKIR